VGTFETEINNEREDKIKDWEENPRKSQGSIFEKNPSEKSI